MYRGKCYSIIKSFCRNDLISYAELCGDFNDIHFDAEYAAKTIFKKPIVHGMLYGSMFGSLVANNIKHSIYLSQTFDFKKPIFVDESFIAEIKVVDEQKVKQNLKLILETSIYKNNENNETKVKAVEGIANVLVLNAGAK